MLIKICGVEVAILNTQHGRFFQGGNSLLRIQFSADCVQGMGASGQLMKQ